MSTCQMKAIVSNAGCNQNYEYLLLILAARAALYRTTLLGMFGFYYPIWLPNLITKL